MWKLSTCISSLDFRARAHLFIVDSRPWFCDAPGWYGQLVGSSWSSFSSALYIKVIDDDFFFSLQPWSLSDFLWQWNNNDESCVQRKVSKGKNKFVLLSGLFSDHLEWHLVELIHKHLFDSLLHTVFNPSSLRIHEHDHPLYFPHYLTVETTEWIFPSSRWKALKRILARDVSVSYFLTFSSLPLFYWYSECVWREELFCSGPQLLSHIPDIKLSPVLPYIAVY